MRAAHSGGARAPRDEWVVCVVEVHVGLPAPRCRSLLYRAVAEYAAGKDVTLLASMAKLKGGRLAREVPDACLQFWGGACAAVAALPSAPCHVTRSLARRLRHRVPLPGMGFTAEVPVSRYYRDMRLLAIGGGADEVMLGIIAKTFGILPKGG